MSTPYGKHPLTVLFQIMRGQRRRLGGGLALGLLQVGTAVPVAWMVKEIFDDALKAAGPGNVYRSGLWLGGLALATALLAIIHRLVSMAAIKAAIAQFRRDLLARIYALPKSYHDRHERGHLHDLAVHDTERLEGLLGALTVQLAPNLGVALVLCVVLAGVAPSVLAIVLLAVVPFSVWSRRSHVRLKAVAARSRQAFGVYNREVITGLRLLDLARLHGRSDEEVRRHGDRIEAVRQASLGSARAMAIHQRAQQLGLFLITVLVLIIGAGGVAEGRYSVGELMSFYALAGILLGYLREAGTGIAHLAEGWEALRKLHAFLREEVTTPYQGTRKINFGGRISGRGLLFAHDSADNAPVVLNSVSFDLVPGKSSVLLGPNGSGKSTLLNLILGLYRPIEGGLSADGVAYDELDMEDLRRQIGVVPQEPVLTTGSVLDNIRYGRIEATRAEVETAARAAGAHAFVSALSEGYDADIGEHGVRLSGGQRQRVALARALLGKPRLLILDEPTNHLDAEAVAGLMRSISELAPECAVLLVTHDRLLAEQLDEICELREGRLHTRQTNGRQRQEA